MCKVMLGKGHKCINDFSGNFISEWSYLPQVPWNLSSTCITILWHEFQNLAFIARNIASKFSVFNHNTPFQVILFLSPKNVTIIKWYSSNSVVMWFVFLIPTFVEKKKNYHFSVLELFISFLCLSNAHICTQEHFHFI